MAEGRLFARPQAQGRGASRRADSPLGERPCPSMVFSEHHRHPPSKLLGHLFSQSLLSTWIALWRTWVWERSGNRSRCVRGAFLFPLSCAAFFETLRKGSAGPKAEMEGARSTRKRKRVQKVLPAGGDSSVVARWCVLLVGRTERRGRGRRLDATRPLRKHGLRSGCAPARQTIATFSSIGHAGSNERFLHPACLRVERLSQRKR
jgi:hypothetical protein